MSEAELTDHSKVSTTVAKAWSGIVALIVVVAIAAISYVNILYSIKQLARDSVTRSDMQLWIDDLREANSGNQEPVKVPSFPRAGMAANAIIAQTRTALELNTEH